MKKIEKSNEQLCYEYQNKVNENEVITDLLENNKKLMRSLVLKLASKINANEYDKEDMLQNAAMGVMRAASTYDESKGCFTTYAVPFIKKYVYRAVQQEKTIIRIPVNKQDLIIKLKKKYGINSVMEERFIKSVMSDKTLTLNQKKDIKAVIYSYNNISVEVLKKDEEQDERGIEIPDSKENVEERAIKHMEACRAYEGLKTLSEKKQLVLKMRYGLMGYTGRSSYGEIGRAINVSGERARQIEHEALAQLKNMMKEDKRAIV